MPLCAWFTSSTQHCTTRAAYHRSKLWPTWTLSCALRHARCMTAWNDGVAVQSCCVENYMPIHKTSIYIIASAASDRMRPCGVMARRPHQDSRWRMYRLPCWRSKLDIGPSYVYIYVLMKFTRNEWTHRHQWLALLRNLSLHCILFVKIPTWSSYIIYWSEQC